jgi:RHS repeat-associated protein
MQFIYCGSQRCEARDGSSNLLRQYFPQGQVNYVSGTGTNYFFTLDHPGSIREMGHMSGGTYVLDSQFSYDPYGTPTQIAGTGATPDFGFATMYYHQRSGLNLTKYRAYGSNLGRWLSRDPLGEFGGRTYQPLSYVGGSNAGSGFGWLLQFSNISNASNRPMLRYGGVNLYSYVNNNTLSFIDPLGLQQQGTGGGQCPAKPGYNPQFGQPNTPTPSLPTSEPKDPNYNSPDYEGPPLPNPNDPDYPQEVNRWNTWQTEHDPSVSGEGRRSHDVNLLENFINFLKNLSGGK